jgi:hypothetical protein
LLAADLDLRSCNWQPAGNRKKLDDGVQAAAKLLRSVEEYAAAEHLLWEWEALLSSSFGPAPRIQVLSLALSFYKHGSYYVDTDDDDGGDDRNQRALLVHS